MVTYENLLAHHSDSFFLERPAGKSVVDRGGKPHEMEHTILEFQGQITPVCCPSLDGSEPDYRYPLHRRGQKGWVCGRAEHYPQSAYVYTPL